MTKVRFVETDRFGLWREGEVAEDLGWESSHPDAPPIRLLRMGDGQLISLTSPYERGLIERVEEP